MHKAPKPKMQNTQVSWELSFYISMYYYMFVEPLCSWNHHCLGSHSADSLKNEKKILANAILANHFAAAALGQHLSTDCRIHIGNLKINTIVYSIAQASKIVMKLQVTNQEIQTWKDLILVGMHLRALASSRNKAKRSVKSAKCYLFL